MKSLTLFAGSVCVIFVCSVAARAEPVERPAPLKIQGAPYQVFHWPAPQLPVQPQQGKWPDFQPGPGGKDRWEESRGGMRSIGPDGKELFIRLPLEFPPPISTPKPFDIQTRVPAAVPPPAKKVTLNELKDQVEEIGARIRQLERLFGKQHLYSKKSRVF